MKQSKRFSKLIIGLALICSFFSPIFSLHIQAASYSIEFKAGAHGTINNQKSVSYQVNVGDEFPDVPFVQAAEGYVFKGWNKELPTVGSKISGKEVYVAKYGVVINGMNYTIHYVDENKVDIATPQTMLGEQGEQYSARPKSIAGYTYQNGEQTFTLDENNQKVYVAYTLTNPEIVIREEITYENEFVNQTIPGTNTEGNQPNNPGNTPEIDIPENDQPQTDGPEVDIPENDQPQTDGPEVDIPENEQPEAKGNQDVNTVLYASIGGVCLLLVAALVYVFYIKKRRNEA